MANQRAPQIIMQGFNDQSARTPPITSENLPVHLPLVFSYAEKGGTDAVIVDGGALTQLYGRKTTDYRGAFATHVTPLIEVLNGAANVMLFKRLQPSDSETATLRLSLDIVAKDIPLYQRNSDGSYVVDGNGDPVPEVGDPTTTGHKMKWVLSEITGAVGDGTQTTGSMTENAVDSTLYPILDFKISSFGAWGNNVGIRLESPTTAGEDPVDSELALEQLAYIHRIRLVERADIYSSPNIIKTKTAANEVEFTFKQDAVNTNTNADLGFNKVFIDAYEDPEADVPIVSPFSSAYVYQSNLEAVQALIFANEQALSSLPDNGEYLIDLFSAHTLDGAPYHAVELVGSLENGIDLGFENTHYCLGGANGTMGNTQYNTDVANQLANFGDLDTPFRDMAKYPFSVFYDTGFDLPTKLLTPNIMAIRKDAAVIDATQDVSLAALSIADESSVAVSLRAALRAVPESTLYGTSTCRAAVMGHAGYMVGSPYKELVPGTIELAAKLARYMGAGTGVFDGTKAPDDEGNKIVQFLRGLNNTYKPITVRNKDWANGLIHIENYDTKQQFFPGLQTVYDDPSSVLNNLINMFICLYCNRVGFEVWRELSGNAKLTNDQFIQRSNEKIREKTRNKFDGRVVIVPDTYFSPADDASGDSWSCNINVYANTMKTTLAHTVVTYRLEDLV